MPAGISDVPNSARRFHSLRDARIIARSKPSWRGVPACPVHRFDLPNIWGDKGFRQSRPIIMSALLHHPVWYCNDKNRQRFAWLETLLESSCGNVAGEEVGRRN